MTKFQRRVIVDECLPRKLNSLLGEFEAKTVPEVQLGGWKNGKLLAAIQGQFDVFVTIDANLEYQQNFSGLDFGIVVIHAFSNRFADIEPLKDELVEAVLAVEAGGVRHVPAEESTGSGQ